MAPSRRVCSLPASCWNLAFSAFRCACTVANLESEKNKNWLCLGLKSSTVTGTSVNASLGGLSQGKILVQERGNKNGAQGCEGCPIPRQT
jgi:hypothetical protein